MTRPIVRVLRPDCLSLDPRCRTDRRFLTRGFQSAALFPSENHETRRELRSESRGTMNQPFETDLIVFLVANRAIAVKTRRP